MQDRRLWPRQADPSSWQRPRASEREIVRTPDKERFGVLQYEYPTPSSPRSSPRAPGFVLRAPTSCRLHLGTCGRARFVALCCARAARTARDARPARSDPAHPQSRPGHLGPWLCPARPPVRSAPLRRRIRTALGGQDPERPVGPVAIVGKPIEIPQSHQAKRSCRALGDRCPEITVAWRCPPPQERRRPDRRGRKAGLERLSSRGTREAVDNCTDPRGEHIPGIRLILGPWRLLLFE